MEKYILYFDANLRPYVRLVNRQGPMSHADLAAVASMTSTWEEHPGALPFIKMSEPPSQELTIKLKRLSGEQAFVFKLGSDYLLQEHQASLGNCPRPPPLNLCVIGQAGTGKSEANKALIWWAYQHGLEKYIVVNSFQ